MKKFGGEESSILHTVFVNDTDTLNTWQNKRKGEEIKEEKNEAM